MHSQDGVMSLPFRLAISMFVISIALPMCVQSLSDGNRELARKVAIGIAENISSVAEEISLKPIGESRILREAEGLISMGPAVTITVGSLLGEENFAIIRCSDSTGWKVTISVDLSPEIVGFCSFDLMPLTIGCESGDLLISHRLQSIGEAVQVGFA